ncbi:molecular chaperone DjiA, partial [Rhizobium leguminosarum]
PKARRRSPCRDRRRTRRGVPKEFHVIANERMAALNAAYEAIEKESRAA